MKSDNVKRAAQSRKYRVRNKVRGTSDRPRLSVFRSNRHVYAQIIDDSAGVTLASACTLAKPLREQLGVCGNIKASQLVGETIAKQALGVGIKCVRFDRGTYKYHGKCKALAEAARKAGLVF